MVLINLFSETHITNAMPVLSLHDMAQSSYGIIIPFPVGHRG